MYRRLDLFYVENWSVGFDLAILMSTFQSVLMRLLWRSGSTELSVTPELAGPAPGHPVFIGVFSPFRAHVTRRAIRTAVR